MGFVREGHSGTRERLKGDSLLGTRGPGSRPGQREAGDQGAAGGATVPRTLAKQQAPIWKNSFLFTRVTQSPTASRDYSCEELPDTKCHQHRSHSFLCCGINSSGTYQIVVLGLWSLLASGGPGRSVEACLSPLGFPAPGGRCPHPQRAHLPLHSPLRGMRGRTITTREPRSGADGPTSSSLERCPRWSTLGRPRPLLSADVLPCLPCGGTWNPAQDPTVRMWLGAKGEAG